MAVPGQVTGTAVDATWRKAYVSWTAPATGGTPTLYRVYRSLVSGSGFSIIGTATYPTAYYLDTDLTQETTYYYKVAAYNADGEGTASAEASDTTITPNMPSGLMYWLNEVIAIESRSSVSNYGATTYGSATYHDARVQYVKGEVTSSGGDILVSTCKITVDGSVTIDTDARITLPDLTTKLFPLRVEQLMGNGSNVWAKVITG